MCGASQPLLAIVLVPPSGVGGWRGWGLQAPAGCGTTVVSVLAVLEGALKWNTVAAWASLCYLVRAAHQNAYVGNPPGSHPYTWDAVFLQHLLSWTEGESLGALQL